MKKILLMISCCLFALTSCEIDNYESPNASIHGSLLMRRQVSWLEWTFKTEAN